MKCTQPAWLGWAALMHLTATILKVTLGGVLVFAGMRQAVAEPEQTVRWTAWTGELKAPPVELVLPVRKAEQTTDASGSTAEGRNEDQWQTSSDKFWSFRISTEKRKYLASEAVTVRAELRNNTASDISLLPVGCAFGNANGDAIGVLGPNTVRYRGPFKSMPPPDKVILTAGEVASAEATIDNRFEGFGVPGKYKISCTFSDLTSAIAIEIMGAEKVGQKEPPKKLAVELGGGVKLDMTLIPAGEFKMGSGESAEDAAAFFNKTYGKVFSSADFFKDEHPQHRVRITKPFYLGTYHVTRGQFRQFVAASGYNTDAEKGERPGAFGWNPDKKEIGFNEKYSWRNASFEQTDEHPVVNVSWNDAVAFCEWLSKKENKTYRLPTEAEWEYACRAGTTTRYYSGDDPETLAKVGNVGDATLKAKFPWPYTIKASDGYAFTAPVGKFKPNAFGLYDMHGNAWQWCSDWYGGEYYAVSPADNPSGLDSGDVRVLRGGSWDYWPGGSRSAGRAGLSPDFGGDVTGFRVARTP